MLFLKTTKHYKDRVFKIFGGVRHKIAKKNKELLTDQNVGKIGEMFPITCAHRFGPKLGF